MIIKASGAYSHNWALKDQWPDFLVESKGDVTVIVFVGGGSFVFDNVLAQNPA
jgi:hypothetical protein